MPVPSFTPNEYLEYIRISSQKFILVEGKTDKRAINLLLDEFDQINNTQVGKEINIDTAEELVKGEGPSIANWQKVETVCQLIADRPFADRLVGFVDRMFREFGLNGPIADHLNDHRVSGRLVWSRGHSLENYFFDASILRESFRSISDFENFVDALDRFVEVLESAIRFACVISLAAKEADKLGIIRGRLGWQLIRLSPSEVALNLEGWKEELIKRRRISADEIDAIIARLDFWDKLIS